MEAKQMSVLETRKLLLDWLEADAPGMTFNMDTGLMVTDDCGTVCCIAGFVASVVSPECQTALAKEGAVPWRSVQRAAVKALGLSYDEEVLHIPHPLFSFEKAPYNCTPAQAAKACRRVFNHEGPFPKDYNPWEGIGRK